MGDDRQVGGDHYKRLKVQPWDVYPEWLAGLDPMAAYLNGTIIKYLARFKYKGGVEDLKKARHCLDRLIEHESFGPVETAPKQGPEVQNSTWNPGTAVFDRT